MSTNSPQQNTQWPTYEEKMSWLMRWVVFIAFIIIFVCALIIVAVTGNLVLVSLPGSLLLFMRPMMHYLFVTRSNSRSRETHEE